MGKYVVTSVTETSRSELAESLVHTRILCLGNELLADDSLGCVVAEKLRELALPGVEIVTTAESGFHLLDHVLGVKCLIVVDTVQTGSALPGTIYEFDQDEVALVPGGSPHYVGLFETIDLARQLGLSVAKKVTVFAVEASDCLTLGEGISKQVQAAIPDLLTRVIALSRTM